MTGQALIVQADALRLPLPDASVDLVVTSPPFAFLRAYDTGYPHLEIGAETTPTEFLEHLWQATAEMVRVLKPTGSMFVDLGDKYAERGGPERLGGQADDGYVGRAVYRPRRLGPPDHGMRAKSLMLLPERYRIGAVDRLGLIARAVIVWDKPNCLSGGTMVYARCKGRPLAIKVHDLCRAYQPEDVQLWNGQRWTQVLWWQPTGRHPDAEESYRAIRAARRQNTEPVIGGDLEIELRSGERIGCTREHRWPTRFGLRQAQDLKVGDVLQATSLPQGEAAPAALDDEMVGWFVGLYIAEGSRSEQTIQIAGHVKELERYKRLCELAEAFHGTCNVYTDGNTANITMAGSFLDAILRAYVGGRIAKDKHLAPKCWQRSNRFLRAVLNGYLSGDGHYEAKANRWTVGFTDNDALAADLRTLGGRLGLSVRLRRVTHTGFGKEWPGWSGNIVEPERRRQPDTEIVAIRQSRARQFWDIGVEDDPHLFALASGVLTHNSLPESVTDRVRRSHEDWVHLTKQPRYYSAIDEVRESYSPEASGRRALYGQNPGRDGLAGLRATGVAQHGSNGVTAMGVGGGAENPLGKLPGSVWSVPSEPLRLPDHLGVQHYAAFPSEWPRRLILGWSPPGICLDCGQGRVPVVERESVPLRPHHPERVGWDKAHAPDGREGDRKADRATILGYACACTPHTNHPGTGEPSGSRAGDMLADGEGYWQIGHGGLARRPKVGPWREYHLDGWKPPPTCPAVVLDPFSGTGTTPMVARALGRVGIGVDLSMPYSRAARWRVKHDGAKAISRTNLERQGSLL